MDCETQQQSSNLNQCSKYTQATRPSGNQIMRILWIPHAPLGVGRSRAEYLMETLAKRHEVYALSFNIYRRWQSLRYLSDLLRYRPRQNPAGYEEIPLARMPKTEWLNTLFLNRAIIREARRRRCEVVVLSPNPYLIGYVNFARLRRYISIVCDYVDDGAWSDEDDKGHAGGEGASRSVRRRRATARAWPGYVRSYVESSDAVICVSRLLTQQARAVNPFSFFIPNGVDLARFGAYRAVHTVRECKSALGIDPDVFVISIIGMTCSSRLYFVDAAIALSRSGRKVVLLLVGPSPLLPAILRRAQGADHVVRIEGMVPHEQIMRYFMATDVGLYAVDDEGYYHRASPLKIFEYAAMGKPVVVAPWLDEVARSSLPNVSFCQPNAEALAKHISFLADNGPPYIESNLSSYDWTALATQVEDILAQVVARRDKKAERNVSLHKSRSGVVAKSMTAAAVQSQVPSDDA
jgi:glycosyltransferase involved in cell wall biosynthesis